MLRGFLDAYSATENEGIQIVIHHNEAQAMVDDTVEIKMQCAIERYTLGELRQRFP